MESKKGEKQLIKGVTIRNIERQMDLEIAFENPVFVLDSVDWDSPSVSMESYRVPFQVGQTLSGVTVGTRKPTITGYVVADTSKITALGKTWEQFFEEQEQQIEESKLELDKLISVYQDVVIQAGDYFLDARPTAPPKYSDTYEENNEVMCFFSLEFECYNPMFYLQSKTVDLASITGMFHFPLIIPPEGVVFGKIMRRQSMFIENAGDSDVGCVITITAVGGQIQDPSVYNVNTGEKIELEGVTIEDGDAITIDTNISKENVVHHIQSESKDVSLIGYVKTGSDYLQIRRGSAYYAYDVDEQYQNNIEVSISYTEQYFNIRGM